MLWLTAFIDLLVYFVEDYQHYTTLWQNCTKQVKFYCYILLLIFFVQGYSFVAPSIIFGENEFTKRLVANKPSEHRPAPGAVDYAALFEVTIHLYNHVD